MKKSFVLYTDMYPNIKDLPESQKSKLLDAIFQYVIDGTEIKLRPETKMAFSFIKTTIDRDQKNWEETRKKRKEAGRLGGLKRSANENLNVANASNAKQIKQSLANQANQAVSVSVSDSVSVSSTVNKRNENISSKQNSNPYRSWSNEQLLSSYKQDMKSAQYLSQDLIDEVLDRGLQ